MTKWYSLGLAFIAALVLFEMHSRHAQKVDDLEASIALAQTQKAALTKQYDALSAEKKEADKAWSTAPAIWQATEDGAPFGDAQAALASLATDSGAILKGLQSGNAQDLGDFKAMRMTLEVEADTEEWQKLMQSLHKNSPTILPVSAQLRRLNRGDTDAKYPATLVRLVVDLPYQPGGAE